MTLDVVDAVLQISKALCKVDLEQIAKEIFEVRAEMGRESNLQSINQSIK